MELNLTPFGERIRAKSPHLTDEEFIRCVREGEAIEALRLYLRQRGSDLGAEGHDEMLYSHNSSFPFPIMQTAREIAQVVLNSANSFGFEQTTESETAVH